MPIVTHEDEKLLARLDVEVADWLKKLSGYIDSLASKEKALGEAYQKYTKELMLYARKMRDKHKQMDVLAREKRSGVEDREVASYKKQIQGIDEAIKGFEGYYDRIKDLSLQKKTMTDRMREYAGIMYDQSKLRKELVNLGLKMEKEKSKMVAADNLSKTEDTMKDVEREFERSKKDLEKKWVQVEEEKAEVNRLWLAFKDSIEAFEK